MSGISLFLLWLTYKYSMYVVICRSQSFYEHVGMYVLVGACIYVLPGEYYLRLFDQFIKKWNNSTGFIP